MFQTPDGPARSLSDTATVIPGNIRVGTYVSCIGLGLTLKFFPQSTLNDLTGCACNIVAIVIGNMFAPARVVREYDSIVVAFY